MKRVTIFFAILLLTGVTVSSTGSTPSSPSPQKRDVSFFFAYDAIGNLIFPTSPPPTSLPPIPPGPLIAPYYAEYSDYYLNTFTSPWTYEPDGYYWGTYYGPIDWNR